MSRVFLCQRQSNFQCRTLTQIIDIRFEGQTKTGNLDIFRVLSIFLNKISNSCFDLTLNPMRFVVINFTGCSNQARLFRCFVHDEPRIYCNAMPANATPRLQNIDARMVISQLNQLPHINVEFFADQ
ncbi:hypothetical protein AX13_01480 [Comamonas aquatica DA1877]|uniref:Uncharacterized protein n=1 Tax=Comamonas aquatica DA1877 TaxID=1457173 RepID=A0A014MPN7_9BURK|nr:hypothetical protein AX13_01480 [Comamonas aquatica DA1877]